MAAAECAGGGHSDCTGTGGRPPARNQGVPG
nr:MAG TPA: hypothetical protein [Caudoviricetes sp.]